MSRFQATRGEEPHLTHLRQIFNVQVKRLGLVVGDLGKDTASNYTGLTGCAAANYKLRAAKINQNLPQPIGGRNEYQDDEGKLTHLVE